LKADTRANSEACSEIPYAAEQGIISEEQGILAWEQGILGTKSEIVVGSGFRYTQVAIGQTPLSAETIVADLKGGGAGRAYRAD
jgi:hypothetical protein